MAFDQTGGHEAVEQPKRVETPPPPPPDRPGTPGSPSRAESRAAAQDNGQPQADNPKEQPSTAPPDSSDREDNEPKDRQEQTEASPSLDQGGPAEWQDTDTAGGLDGGAGEALDSPVGVQREPGDQPNERSGDDSTSDQILRGNADSGAATEASDTNGDLGNADQGQTETSGAAQRPIDESSTATEKQSGDAHGESSEQPKAETDPQQADRDTNQNHRPDANTPDQPLYRAQETEQPISESPDATPDLPETDADAPSPAETPDGLTRTGDQPGDPQTPPDQTAATTNQPDQAVEGSPGEDTERSKYKIPYEQFIAESYGLSQGQIDEAINRAREQRENDLADSAKQEGDAAKLPTGEELLEMEDNGDGRRRRAKDFYEEIDDVGNLTDKAFHATEDALKAIHPPTGYAETRADGEFKPAPHEGINAGELTTAGLVFGMVATEGVKKIIGWAKRRTGK